MLGPRARTAWAARLIAFHAGIWFSSRLSFVLVLVLLVAIVVPLGPLVDRLRGRRTPERVDLEPLSRGPFRLGRRWEIPMPLGPPGP